jgi:hypothetical protein
LSNHWVTSKPWSDFVHTIGRSMLDTWHDWMRDLTIVGSVAFIVLFVIGLTRGHAETKGRSFVAPIAAITCAGVLLAERWVPFPRVWTFLLPLFFMTASAGIAVVVEARKGSKAWLGLLAIFVCLAMAAATLSSGSVSRSTATGFFPDGEKVALALPRLLRPGDVVFVKNPADGVLEYYAELHHIRLPITTKPTGDARALIVVDTAAGQTLDSMVQQLRAQRFAPIDLARAHLKESFPSSSVYAFSPVARS